MKKLGFVFQILVFVWMQLASPHLYANDISQTEGNVKAVPPMPQNYRLPDMHLLDTVAFYSKFHNKVGQRVDVEGIVGRFGATFGEDFKQKIYEIEKQYNERIEIILTLTSTLDDAKILKQKLEEKGRKMVIVEIPDWLQDRIIETAVKRAANPKPQIEWNAENSLKRIKRPTQSSVTNAIKIIKNQYVKPSKQEVRIAAISASSAGTITAVGLALAVGMDPITVAALTLAKTLFVGTTAAYSKTIGNLIKADLSNELKVMTGARKVAAETYYALSTNAATSFGDYGISSALGDTMNSLSEQAANNQKEKKLSETAQSKLFWYTFAFGAVMGMMGSLGLGGPQLLSTEYFKVSYLQGASLLFTISLFFAYKYRAQHVEKVVQADLRAAAKARMDKLQKVREVIMPKNRNFRFTTAPLSCSQLFF